LIALREPEHGLFCRRLPCWPSEPSIDRTELTCELCRCRFEPSGLHLGRLTFGSVTAIGAVCDDCCWPGRRPARWRQR
jgi:hypothetical protein